MLNQSLLFTLGGGSLLAFLVFFIAYKLLHFKGITSSLITALVMLLIYVPYSILNWSGVDTFAIHFTFFMMIAFGLGLITSGGDTSKTKKALHWGPIVIIVFFILLAMVDSTIISFATKGLEGNFAEMILPEPKKLEKKLDAESIALQEKRNRKRLGDDFKATYLEGIDTGTQSKFPGTVSYDVRNREAKYNSDLAQMKEQKERGWKAEGGWVKPPAVNTTETFRLVMVDKEGVPLKDLRVEIDFMRPSDKSKDQRHVMSNMGDGSYETVTNLSGAGVWNIEIKAMRGEALYKIKGKTTVLPEGH